MFKYDVIPRGNGRSWTVRDGSRELGIVVITRPGRRTTSPFYAAYSAIAEGRRWDLAAHPSLEAAVLRVEEFDADPESFGRRVHQVDSATIEQRR